MLSDDDRLQACIDIVCSRRGVTPDQITGPSRRRELVRARQLVWALARRLTDRSYPELARRFNRDHTTILSGVERLERGVDPDEYREYMTTLAATRKHLGGLWDERVDSYRAEVTETTIRDLVCAAGGAPNWREL